MGYQLPSSDELIQLADFIEQEYRSQKGLNPSRLSFITLLKNMIADEKLMASPDAAKILMGAYVFELQHIENSYSRYPLNAERSVMYRALKKGLKITAENKITDERKLIYTSAFYHYIRDQAPANITTDTKWMTKEALRVPVMSVIRGLLTSLQKQIHCILTSQPSYQQLQQHLQNMEARYLAQSKPRFWSIGGEHLPLAKFVDLINQYCDNYLPHVEADTLDPALQVLESYLLRTAATLFVMKSIETAKYRPANSCMYNTCCKAINVTHSSDIALVDQINWLGMLESHIKSMLENRKDFLLEREKAGYSNIIRELEKIRGGIYGFQSAAFKQKESPSAIRSNMTLATGGVAEYGIQAVVKNVVGDIVPTPAATVAGVMGLALGPGGMFAAVAISHLVRKIIFPLAVAGAYAGAVNSAGNKIGEATTNVVVAPFAFTGKAISSIVNWYRQVDLDKKALRTDTELLEALAALPDDVFAPESKAKIENAYGIKPASGM